MLKNLTVTRFTDFGKGAKQLQLSPHGIRVGLWCGDSIRCRRWYRSRLLFECGYQVT